MYMNILAAHRVANAADSDFVIESSSGLLQKNGSESFYRVFLPSWIYIHHSSRSSPQKKVTRATKRYYSGMSFIGPQNDTKMICTHTIASIATITLAGRREVGITTLRDDDRSVLEHTCGHASNNATEMQRQTTRRKSRRFTRGSIV